MIKVAEIMLERSIAIIRIIEEIILLYIYIYM